MFKKLSPLLVLLILLVTNLSAQQLTPQQYIAQYKDVAIREMKRMGVPASITLAQGLLETESGNSSLVKKSNNHFGIKCKSNWTGPGVTHDDDAIGECFRSYKDAEESFRDHSNFLRGSERYSGLFTLNPADYKGWAKGLKKAGYATNPKYPDILIKNIEQYNLQQYSLVAVDEMPIFELNKNEDDKENADGTIVAETGTNNKLNSIREFTGSITAINGSKCLLAAKGTSLLAIATQNDIPLSKLLSYNDLTTDGLIAKDQLIYLEKKQEKGAMEYYNIQQGETLYDVAQRQGIQLQSLLAYNNLREDAELQHGTQLNLQQNKASIAANVVKEATETPIKTHLVQPKEGLYTISKKYNVTVTQLKEWNHLTGNNLSIGQQLIVAR